MIEAILIGITGALLMDRLFFPSHKRDDLARKAIQAVAEQMNKKILFLDFHREVSLWTKDFQREIKDRKAKNEELEAIYGAIERGDKVNADTLKNLASKAEKIDSKIAEGVDALARHLKLEIMPFHTPEEKGFKIVKIKKLK